MQAGIKIKFLIVGGGIGGMACAYALRRSGHEVHVVEKAKGLGQNPAGVIRAPPNLNNILIKWGLGPELAKTALKCRGNPMIDMKTGEQIGCLEYPEGLLKDTGADFTIIRHEDLHRMLYKLALDSGVTVQFNAHVTDIDPDTPSVRLCTGETISADVLVGADGYRSRVRDVVLGSEEHRATPSGISIYTMNIPISNMESDPELKVFLDTPKLQFPIFMGSGRSVNGHLMHFKEEYALHVFWPDDDESSEESWSSSVPLSDLDFSTADPRPATPTQQAYQEGSSWHVLQKLIKSATSAVRTKYVNHEPIEDWVHENGKVVIIGEAAHPQLPAGGHGADMAVEDAAVLGSLFSRLRTRDRITSLLFAFQEVRGDRCAYVQQNELSNIHVAWMEAGPERDARDAGMRMALQSSHGWEEDYLKSEWDTLTTIIGYDAYEAAEEWWLQWGALREKAEGITHEAPSHNAARTDSFYTIDVVQESGQPHCC